MSEGQRLASIILAAGQGTRMKSERAKVLHALGGEPLIAYPLQLALDSGADPIVVVIGHQKDAVREKVGALFPVIGSRLGKAEPPVDASQSRPEKVAFAEQLEQKGTGHAVMEGLKPIDARLGEKDRVLLLYGDVPLLTRATIEALTQATQGRALAIVTTKVAQPKGYGRIVRDAAGKIRRVVEEKDASEAERKIDEINAGIYLVEAGFLRSALSRLSNANAQREYYLTDIIGFAIEDGREVGFFCVADPGEVLGVNTRGELAHMEALVRRAINERHMREGVSIVDPERTYISRAAKIGRDTVIQPGAHLRGNTEIGEACLIDTGVVITDGKIGARVEIKPHSVIDSAIVREDAIIGPFARLRPAAEIMPGAHVGNFVELKNAQLGKGAKANHLAYLGDATIGEGANIGAGTITCNYDGYGKYQTTIGERVFIGSNSTLVAPVTIEKDAYVAAGSTITDPVGAGDLAFGRARQETKQGRAEPLRKRAQEKAAEAKRAAGAKKSK